MRLQILAGFAMVLMMGALSGAPTDGPPARTVRVALAAASAPAGAIHGTVTLRALMGPHSPLSMAFQSLTEPVAFMVPARTMWEASVTVRGLWAAPVVVIVQDSDAIFPITLVPTGSVTGSLASPQGTTAPRALSANVDVPPGAKKLPGPTSAQTPCTVADDATFRCDVPVGTLDLSFHAPGFIAVYRWGVAIEKDGRKDLGRFALSQGSSVAGFVTLVGARLEAGKGKAALFIAAPGASITASRLSRPVAEAAVAANGFFQMADVPTGHYVLQATYPGFAAATISPVDVYAHVESKLKRPIELQTPAKLTLKVDPTTDAHGKDWILLVFRASAVNYRYEAAPIFNGAAKDGVVVLRDQPGGRYKVMIGDGSNTFATEEFTTAGSGDETHTFSPDFVQVKGTVRRGDIPLAATLWFGGRFGEKHVVFRSNDEGAFGGVLPAAGSWRVHVQSEKGQSDVMTEIAKPEKDKVAAIELFIPANRIEGVVVDAADHPLDRAVVTLSPSAELTGQMQQTDASGHFAFDGVTPGAFKLVADYDAPPTMKSSTVYAATVGEADTLEGIILKVRDGRAIHGRVLGSDGPVIGADVSIYPGGGFDLASTANATSGPDGVFDTSIASGFDRALVEVDAPGYALRVFDIAIDGRAVTLNLPQAGGALFVTTPKEARGILFFQDGRLLTLEAIAAWAQSRGEQFLDGNTFHAADIAPGRYRACTMRPGGLAMTDMTRCAEGFLPPYGELHLTIQ